jgi:hypothetical protein
MAYSPMNDALSTKADAKRTSGSKVTAAKCMAEQGGRGIYIYDMWLSLAIKIMALDATPLEFLPHAQDMH